MQKKQASNQAQLQSEPIYRLVTGTTGTPTDFFGPATKLLLTPEDLELEYQYPKELVVKLVKANRTLRRPISVLKIGDELLFPTLAFRIWLLEMGKAKRIA